jgi:hypothetical protein
VLNAYIFKSVKNLHDLIADKIEIQPSLLHVALENIERWRTRGHTDLRRLEQWREIILQAQKSPEIFRQLLAILRDRNEPAERMKDFAPFAVVLDLTERRRAEPSCAYHF